EWPPACVATVAARIPGLEKRETWGTQHFIKLQSAKLKSSNAQPAPRRLFHLRFRWLGCFAFQFDHDHIHPFVAGVLRQVGLGRAILRITCLDGKVFRFPVRIAELPVGVGEEHRNRGGMAVHDRLLVRAVVHLQNPHLGVFAHYRVMLGINFGRILRREDRDETEAQHRTIKRQWHSHFTLLVLRGFVGKALYPTLALSPMSIRLSVTTRYESA